MLLEETGIAKGIRRITAVTKETAWAAEALARDFEELLRVRCWGGVGLAVGRKPAGLLCVCGTSIPFRGILGCTAHVASPSSGLLCVCAS
jgi:hypothetical protein